MSQPTPERRGAPDGGQGETMDNRLDALIRERIGDQPYGTFFSTGEGSFYPDGTEESSGSVVAADGRHYTYWTGWKDGRLILDEWEVSDPRWLSHLWLRSHEYRDALARAGRTTASG